jgi:hypothetical protein
VKQKRQAIAAFLGVMAVPRKVVGRVLHSDNNFDHFGAFARPDMHSIAGKAGLAGWPLVNRINLPWPEGLTVFATKRPQRRGCGLEA